MGALGDVDENGAGDVSGSGRDSREFDVLFQAFGGRDGDRAEAVPVCEKSSIDEFYADLSGMDRFFGCWQFSRELRERVIRESGLPISVGLSTSKTVAKVATGEAKPTTPGT